MPAPTRTISRRTLLPHRGRRVVLIIPPFCDYVSLRLAGTRTTYDVSLAAVFDLAAKQYVASKLKGGKHATRKKAR